MLGMHGSASPPPRLVVERRDMLVTRVECELHGRWQHVLLILVASVVRSVNLFGVVWRGGVTGNGCCCLQSAASSGKLLSLSR